jgi:hypothetical protein
MPIFFPTAETGTYIPPLPLLTPFVSFSTPIMAELTIFCLISRDIKIVERACMKRHLLVLMDQLHKRESLARYHKKDAFAQSLTFETVTVEQAESGIEIWQLTSKLEIW